MHDTPALLVIAHGTRSATGLATIDAIVAALATARPGTPVELCYLDVAHPTLPEALDGPPRPRIAVPLLLSTGYHVQHDIPEAVAGHPDARVARHLGPDPALVDALVARLEQARGERPATTTVLAASGSSRPEAADELAATAELLTQRLRRPVPVLTMAGDLRDRLAALPQPIEVATYLLAEGQFVGTLRGAADGLGPVAEPIGAHPALVSLVWRRYDATR